VWGGRAGGGRKQKGKNLLSGKSRERVNLSIIARGVETTWETIRVWGRFGKSRGGGGGGEVGWGGRCNLLALLLAVGLGWRCVCGRWGGVKAAGAGA